MTLNNLPELLTPAETAELLRTTTNSLSQDRYLGRGVRFIRAGRRILYARADVLAYLEANTFEQSPGRARVSTHSPPSVTA
ncbi:helix-turn-helix domain-containing protein [Mycobacterium sp. E3298]|uniref:helix-turn-helix domain-containing protein n=1 Tax=Mycobacterium sp. E3298 TaxID=1856865 RepID=UPI0034CF63A0